MDQVVSYEALIRFSKSIFQKIGCSDHDAGIAAAVLVSADLRGVDSHGVARLSGYVRLKEAARVNTKPHFTIVHETPGTAVLDADQALGLVVSPFAMQLAIEKAKHASTGWVAVQNSNHFGIAGFHAMMALPHDMIGIAMTNASALVAPTFSKERMLGTNPIAVAIPAGEENAFVGDFATTTAANGKLEILQRKNLDAPLGWVQSREGEPTTNANSVKEGGSLLPLGGDREHSSHKGYILGSLVDIFCGILSGANFGPWVPPFPAYIPIPEFQPGKGIGHFFGAMRIDAFRKPEDFKKDMDMWIRRFKQAVPIHEDQPVVIPGQPELEMEMERKANGIPLITNVYNDLLQLGEKYQVAFNKD